MDRKKIGGVLVAISIILGILSFGLPAKQTSILSSDKLDTKDSAGHPIEVSISLYEGGDICITPYLGKVDVVCSVTCDGHSKTIRFDDVSLTSRCRSACSYNYNSIDASCRVYSSYTNEYLGTLHVSYHKSPSCANECSYRGQTKYYCSGDSIYKKTCGDYDSDSCLEWSSSSYVKNCNSQDGWYCKDDYTKEYRDYYCSGGSCRYTVIKTERCPEGYKCSGGKCIQINNYIPCSSSSDVDISIMSLSPSKKVYKPGEYIDITVRIKNNRNRKLKTLVEAGAIPYSLAINWGIVPGRMSIMPLAVIKETSCCKGQENFDDKYVSLDPYEEETITFRIRLPYNGIKDLCYNNRYWNGEGKYVIYVGAFKDCYPNNKLCSSFEYKIVEIKSIEKKPVISEWTINIKTLTGGAAAILGVVGLWLLLA